MDERTANSGLTGSDKWNGYCTVICWGEWSSYQCGRKATRMFDGAPVCGQHGKMAESGRHFEYAKEMLDARR